MTQVGGMVKKETEPGLPSKRPGSAVITDDTSGKTINPDSFRNGALVAAGEAVGKNKLRSRLRRGGRWPFLGAWPADARIWGGPGEPCIVHEG